VAGEQNGVVGELSRGEVLAALGPWLESRRRAAWRPVVAAGEPSGSLSKFCGVAWLVPGEPAPTCGECGRTLRLFVQLDLGALPHELGERFGSGVLQLFYCVDQDDDAVSGSDRECFQDEAWAPFSDVASRVRIVPRDALHPPDPSPGSDGLPAAAIVGWDRFDDLPDPEDHSAAGLAVAYDFGTRTASLRCDEVGLAASIGIDDLPVEDIAEAADGDKLAGWPYWVQGSEYPTCPHCGTSMQLVVQITSEGNVPFMFGDMGVGHITQCPTHHDTVAFAWACS
jgi:uncharacterized protein YwqG